MRLSHKSISYKCLSFVAAYLLLQACGVREAATPVEGTTPAISTQLAAISETTTSITSPTSSTTIPIELTTASLSPMDERDSAEIAYFQSELQRPDLDPTIRAGYEDQVSTLRYWIGQRATARALGVTPGNIPAPTASDPTSTPYPRGLLQPFNGNPTPPRLDGFFVVQNGWFDGENVAVYAGAPISDPTQGTLAILQNQPDGSVQEDWYAAPVQDGALSILSEQNNIFVLETANGTSLIFNLNTRTFDNIPIQSTPVATP